MKSSTTYLNWFRRLVVLGAVVGVGVFVANAGAVNRPPDVQDVAASLSSDVNRPPDIQDVASRMSADPPKPAARSPLHSTAWSAIRGWAPLGTTSV